MRKQKRLRRKLRKSLSDSLSFYYIYIIIEQKKGVGLQSHILSINSQPFLSSLTPSFFYIVIVL